MAHRGEGTAAREDGDHGEPRDGGQDVERMAADQDVEGSAVRPAPERQAVAHEARPLGALNGEEHRAEERGQLHPPGYPVRRLAPAHRAERAGEGEGARQEHRAVERRQAERQARLIGGRPGAGREPEHEVHADQPREEHRFAGDQDDHGEARVADRRSVRRGERDDVAAHGEESRLHA